MRSMLFMLVLSSAAWSQSLLEHAAAAGGGSVGGIAGKKVSDGLTSIFGKVDKQTQKAASAGETKGTKTAAPEPLLEVGPGTPRQRPSVPPPPPLHRAAVHKPAPLPVSRVVPMLAMAPPAIAETKPVTSGELRLLSAGASRSDVLKLGPPAARITMYDDGHLIEIYRYQDHDASLGVVRLTDGSVSNVLVH